MRERSPILLEDQMSQEENQSQDILQLLAEGKIDATEAAAILSSMKRKDKSDPESQSDVLSVDLVEEESEFKKGPLSENKPTWFHVKVSDIMTGRNKVIVNIPLGLVLFGLNIGRHFAPELDQVDLDQLASQIQAESGLLVEVMDEEDGEHVQIYVD
jgi:hypothetical protein